MVSAPETYVIAIEPIGYFRPSEEVDAAAAELLATAIARQGVWTAPVPVDQHTGIVMDGNHRLQAARLLGLDYVPCVPLGYHDPRVSVTHWATAAPYDVRQIFRIVAEQRVLPFKTTRHRFQPALPQTAIPVVILGGDPRECRRAAGDSPVAQVMAGLSAGR